jgi:hypothetical protein
MRREHGMVGKPAVHVGHSLDRQIATAKHCLHGYDAWIVPASSRPLRGFGDVLCKPYTETMTTLTMNPVVPEVQSYPSGLEPEPPCGAWSVRAAARMLVPRDLHPLAGVEKGSPF